MENKNKSFPIIEKSRPETVFKITGKVVKREKGTENPELKTGKIEVKYDTNRVGPIRKAITVTSNADTPTKVLKIKGTVKTPGAK